MTPTAARGSQRLHGAMQRMRMLACAACTIVTMAAAFPAWPDAALDVRLKSLETQLRCLVCQNQTLAESNAPLAEDLRKEVRELAVSGKSDDDIRSYLVARYGDFVLYKPPVKPETYLLWFGPFVLLAAGILAWLVVLRRRSGAKPHGSDPDPTLPGAETGIEVARARELLDD